ncbi:MAG: sirohydrochlorin chelatase [Rhodococcus sp. (in: high G+C Gram-positive bacteria)]
MTTLIAVAHGSRDPRSARTVAAVVDRIRARRPDLDVRVAFLDLTEPSVEDVLDGIAAQHAAGSASAVLVPLLLGSAFHARVDLPGILQAARSRHPHLRLEQAEVLGDDRRLVTALRQRVFEAGVDAGDSDVGIAVAAVGSSDESANQRTRALAERVVAGTSWKASVTCFATGPTPGAADALQQLTAVGARTIVVAPWFLAPGRLTDRVFGVVEQLGTEVVEARVLGDHPLVADVVSSRYDAAVAALAHRRTA